MNETNQLHVVIGASGGAGSAVVHELVARGKRVRAVNRSGKADLPAGVEMVAADISDPQAARRVCAGASVVYNCANPPYHRWAEMFPPLVESTLEACAAAGARLVFADNLYMYGQVNGPMREDTPVQPNSKKGEVRARLAERLLQAHRSGYVQVTIGRASDFYGPGVLGSSAGETVFAEAVKGGTANVIGDVDALHTYTYTPDFARGLAILAESERAFGEVWHIPNSETLTTRRFLEQVYAAAGHPLKFRSANRLMLSALGLFSPTLKEMKDIYYQFSQPFVVDHSKFERAFGSLPATPAPEAIAATVAWYRTHTGDAR